MTPFRHHIAHLVCVFGVTLTVLRVTLADGGDWLTVIHTSDIQSHFDESGASAKACAAGAYCFGGVPRLVNLVRRERAEDENVLVLDAGGLFNTALLNNTSAPEILRDLVNLIGYDAMALGEPELIGDLDSVERYMSLIGTPFICTAGLIPPSNGSANTPLCNSSLLLTMGRLKVGIVSYLSPNLPEFQYHPPPEGFTNTALDVVKEETSRLRTKGARLIIALVYTSWTSVSRNMTDITHALTDVDLAVIGNAGRFFYNGAAPHGEEVSGPYPIAWEREGGRPLLAVSMVPMLHYAGRLRLKVAADGGCSDWDANNPILLDGDKDATAEKVMERLRPSQDTLLGGLVARSLYVLEGDAHCHIRECALGSLVADSILEAAIQPEYKGNDILAWTRAGTALYHGSLVHSSISAGLIREEDLRVALPLEDPLVIVSVLGSRLANILEMSVSRNMYMGLQVSGLRLGITANPENPGSMKVNLMKVLCTVCQMPAFKDINHRYTYRVVSTESTVKTILSKAGRGLQSERMNLTIRDAARKIMRKLSPMAIPRETRIARLTVHQQAVTGSARMTRGAAMRVAGVLMLLLVVI